jgi:exopolyphosphatase/guanosine-5'-triphosphate,3'-diphosphate pyrophosphatase
LESGKRLAVLDIGTNSFHLLIVETIIDSNTFEIIYRERKVFRLTNGFGEQNNLISEKAIQQATVLIRKFSNISLSYGTNLKAVATSAVRGAINKDKFCMSILRNTGINIEVLNGVREAELIYRGVNKLTELDNVKSLIVDIGGGSTEFIVSNHGKIESILSVEIGAVKLMQMYFPELRFSEERIASARVFVANKLSTHLHLIEGKSIDMFIGTSGTIFNVCRMIVRKEIDAYEVNKCDITSDEINKIENIIYSKKNYEELKSIAGLDKERADIITSGLIILSVVFEIIKIDRMTYSKYSLREGVLTELL